MLIHGATTGFSIRKKKQVFSEEEEKITTRTTTTIVVGRGPRARTTTTAPLNPSELLLSAHHLIEHERSVLLAGRAGRAVVAACIGAPERLRGARLHDAAVHAAVAALGAGVVADHGPREEPAVVAAFRELGVRL